MKWKLFDTIFPLIVLWLEFRTKDAIPPASDRTVPYNPATYSVNAYAPRIKPKGGLSRKYLLTRTP